MKKQICRTCKSEKPLTKEFFHFRNDRNEFRKDCVECRKLWWDKYHSNNRDKINRQKREAWKRNINIKSKPEQLIEQFLVENRLEYFYDVTHPECKSISGTTLSFDFWIPPKECVIEYDGEFHYKPIFGEEKLLRQKENDLIKDNFCEKMNLSLIRIPYWELGNIKNILNESFGY